MGILNTTKPGNRLGIKHSKANTQRTARIDHLNNIAYKECCINRQPVRSKEQSKHSTKSRNNDKLQDSSVVAECCVLLLHNGK